MRLPPAPRLRDAIARTYIIAHREDTAQLEAELAAQGLPTIVQRKAYDVVEKTYSGALRCLLNHDAVWQREAAAEGLVLIVEADFVPCRNFAELPLPFDPAGEGSLAWAYLYAGGPRVFERTAMGHLRGHACASVAYVMSPQVAALAHTYVQELRTRHPDWREYYGWDTDIQWHLMGKGAKCFVPERQYGEHGGIANPEHLREGMGASWFRRFLARFAIGLNHYADVLAGPLSFLPLYARGRRSRVWAVRFEGRVVGWLRLLTGRMAMPLGQPSVTRRLNVWLNCARRLLP